MNITYVGGPLDNRLANVETVRSGSIITIHQEGRPALIYTVSREGSHWIATHRPRTRRRKA